MYKLKGKTPFKKIIVCAEFPKDYPKTPLLVELKRKTSSENLLSGLTNICEQECKKKILGKAQVLPVLKFIRNFIHENSPSCCYNDINKLKELLGDRDKLQIRQKDFKINLTVYQGLYYFKVNTFVLDEYPEAAVRCEERRRSISTDFNDSNPNSYEFQPRVLSH